MTLAIASDLMATELAEFMVDEALRLMSLRV